MPQIKQQAKTNPLARQINPTTTAETRTKTQEPPKKSTQQPHPETRNQASSNLQRRPDNLKPRKIIPREKERHKRDTKGTYTTHRRDCIKPPKIQARRLCTPHPTPNADLWKTTNHDKDPKRRNNQPTSKMMIDRATEESLQKSKPKGKVETQGRNKGKRPEQRPKKQLIIIKCSF